MRRIFLSLALVGIWIPVDCFSSSGFSEPDWKEGATFSVPRSNPYGYGPTELDGVIRAGRIHALKYPVEVSGAFVPWRPVRDFIDKPSFNPIRLLLQAAFKGFSRIRSTDDAFAYLGLLAYPTTAPEGSLDIPYPEGVLPKYRMGVTLTNQNGVEAATISCAACHTGNLFGKKILGMTNRFPKANEFFLLGKKATSLISPSLFAGTLGATRPETELYTRLRDRIRFVGAKAPTQLGLDTSLAQVALSLAHRGLDEYASLDPETAAHPRAEKLENFIADSKPAVWWNTKYKNRWLSDGSVVSGNPIFTNFIWNEIGRGTELHELEAWLAENHEKVEELTTAVFATEAPLYTDFFPAETIPLERAKNGKRLFERTCSECHGTYEKVWDLAASEALPYAERLRTSEVHYAKQTPVVNVGTDPQRYEGMKSLATGLNSLALSKKSGVLIRPQSGYVPPPLVGIWARFPYFHNNSAPTLCAVLTAGPARPDSYWAGETLDRSRDFDSECVGYPAGARVPSKWKEDVHFLYTAGKPGLSKMGHDEGIFLDEGHEVFTPAEKMDLIYFLKTL